MHVNPADIASFILVTVVLKMVVAGAVGDVLRRSFKRWLIRTERDLVIWVHTRQHAAGLGHAPRHSKDCVDGMCPPHSAHPAK